MTPFSCVEAVTGHSAVLLKRGQWALQKSAKKDLQVAKSFLERESHGVVATVRHLPPCLIQRAAPQRPGKESHGGSQNRGPLKWLVSC